MSYKLNRERKEEYNSEERWQKSDEAQQFSEDRAQLLDIIREMIDLEFERRGMKTKGNHHPENPPPESMGLESFDCKPPRRSLWQCIVRLFTA